MEKLFMKKTICTFVLVFAFISNAMAFDFLVSSYVTIVNGVKTETSKGHLGLLEMKKGNFGKGYEEDYLELRVILDEHTGLGAWFMPSLDSKFMLCELLDANNIKQPVYTITEREQGVERCVIFYPVSDDQMHIYLVNPRNVNDRYTIISAHGTDIYENVVKEIVKASRAGVIRAASCNGFLNNLYLFKK